MDRAFWVKKTCYIFTNWLFKTNTWFLNKVAVEHAFISILPFLFDSANVVKLLFLFYFGCKTELAGQNDQLEKTFLSWSLCPPNLQNKTWRGTSERHSSLCQITWFLKTLCISSPQSGKWEKIFLFMTLARANTHKKLAHSSVFQLFQKFEIMTKNMDAYSNKKDT